MLVIIGILLAIAVPSYLGFKDRAKRGAAQANVRSAVPAVEAYYADHGTYTDMALTSGDARLHADEPRGRSTPASRSRSSRHGDRRRTASATRRAASRYYKNGPAGDITTAACT